MEQANMTTVRSAVWGTLRAGLALLLACVPMGAHAILSCSAGAASLPVLNPSSVSAAVGDYTLTCNGGNAADPLPLINVSVFLNAPVLPTSMPVLTDGANDYPGLVAGNQVSFLGVAFDPVATDYEIEQILVDPSLRAPGFAYLELVSVGGAVALPIPNPNVLVALNASEPVPEPASWCVLVIGCAATLVWGQRRRSGRNLSAN
jgi:hypothetical protein